LTPAAGRANLDIVLNAQATKLLQTGTVSGMPSFHGVTVQEKPGGKPQATVALLLYSVLTCSSPASPRNLTAKYEIVLSAGTFGTPALLQLSGIGDKATLQAAGISTIVNNPSVGMNMSDHALVPGVFSVNSTDTFETVFRDQFNQDLGHQRRVLWLMAYATITAGSGFRRTLPFSRMWLTLLLVPLALITSSSSL
jgi:choline dehydrogenase-like flavoprotein